MSTGRNPYRDALLGVATGDALGIPYEFKSRDAISSSPATDMIGYGTYRLPAGTWSDDSSLTFCLAEALTKEEFSLRTIAGLFERWLYANHWTPHGAVFDVGMTTREAIGRYSPKFRPELAGGMDEYSNGNGSLMRILPLVFYTQHLPVEERYAVTGDVSSLTHGHVRSVISCFYYLEFARLLLRGTDKFEIYIHLQGAVSKFLGERIAERELRLFSRLLKDRIYELDESEIFGSGYVLHSLEAGIWCLLTTDNYKDAVLKAVNLGEDTDTTAAITGGLAGLVYGYESIPAHWLELLARKNDIIRLADQLKKRFEG